ncbi:MAG: response regulator [Gammaproteobacteria bacterium]|jgi:twitching motility two-component system response regulator PilH
MPVNKIMVVDDSPAHLQEMQDAVSSVNAKVITASSGKEAVAKAKKEMPDIIFMDIVMDDLDGYGACRDIKSDPQTAKIPVVFVTTKNNRADRLWAGKQGATAMISKPYEPEQLLEQIRQVG